MSDTLKIMGVDNGTSLMGISLNRYNIKTKIMKVLETNTLEAKDFVYDYYPKDLERRGKQNVRIQWMRQAFKYYLDYFTPDIIAIETPFIGSSKTLGSYGPLLLLLEGLIDDIYQYSDNNYLDISVEKVSPGEVKRVVTPPNTKYNHSKDVIPKNLQLNPYINLNGVDLSSIGEDAIDSIAVAYAGTTRIASY